MFPQFMKSDGAASQSPVTQTAETSLTSENRTMPMPTYGCSTVAQSVIGSDVKITGFIVSKGDLRLDGEVYADVRAARVFIGPDAQIVGDVTADHVEVRGKLSGTIRAKYVCLASACQVDGDLYHQKLTVEEGALFEGKSRRSEDPTADLNTEAQQIHKLRDILTQLQEQAPAKVGIPPAARSDNLIDEDLLQAG